MRVPEHYAADVLFFFDGHPEELALYEALFRAVEAAFPEGSVRVQKTQISFYGRHLFAAASEGLAEDLSGGDRRPFVPAGLAPGSGGFGALSRPLDPPHPGDGGGSDR